MTAPNIPTREVAGLNIPLPLIPRIIKALRATYPGITDGIEDDEAAVRAVLKEIISSALSVHESQMAANAVRDEIQQKQEAAEKSSSAAYAKARHEVATYVKDAITPELPPPPPEPVEPTPPPEEPTEEPSPEDPPAQEPQTD
jgi:hypothetical protein